MNLQFEWGRSFDQLLYSTPVIADLDRDGVMETVERERLLPALDELLGHHPLREPHLCPLRRERLHPLPVQPYEVSEHRENTHNGGAIMTMQRDWLMMLILLMFALTACGYYPHGELLGWYCDNVTYELTDAQWVIQKDNVSGILSFTIRNLNEYPYDGINIDLIESDTTTSTANGRLEIDDWIRIASFEGVPLIYHINTSHLRGSFHLGESNMLDVFTEISVTPILRINGSTIRCSFQEIKKEALQIQHE